MKEKTNKVSHFKCTRVYHNEQWQRIHELAWISLQTHNDQVLR